MSRLLAEAIGAQTTANIGAHATTSSADYLSLEEARTDLTKLFSEYHGLQMAKATLEGFEKAFSMSMENDGGVSPYLKEAIRPTLESIVSSAEEIDFDHITLEQVSGFVNRLAQAISNLFTRIISKFKHFIERVKKGTDGIRNEVYNLSSQIDRLDANSEPKSETFRFSSGAKLHIDHSMEPAVLAEKYPETATTTSSVAKVVSTFASNLMNHIYDTQKLIAEADVDSTKDIKKMELQARQRSAIIIREYMDALNSFKDKSLAGGYVVSIVASKQYKIMSDTGFSSDPANIPSLFNVTKLGKYKDRGKTTTPTVAEMRGIVNAALQNIDAASETIDYFNKLYDDMHANYSGGKYIRKLGIKHEYNPNSSVAENIGGVLGTMVTNYFSDNLNSWVQYMFESFEQINDYQIRTTQAAKDYLSAALSQYE